MNNILPRHGTMDDAVIREQESDAYHVAPFLREGDVVLDVGAYIGAFALFVKKIVPQAHIFCLEPMPSNFLELKKNVPATIMIEQVALVGKPGPVTVYDFGADASACHSIYNLGVVGARPVKVQGKTLDQIVQERGFSRIRLLKLDCQGAEYEIIPSTPPDILKRIDYIGMEVHASIAKTNQVIGTIENHNKKREALIEHLLRTHVPLRGNIYSDSIQLWANCNLFSRHIEFSTRFRNVIWAKWSKSVLSQARWSKLQIKHLLDLTFTSARYK